MLIQRSDWYNLSITLRSGWRENTEADVIRIPRPGFNLLFFSLALGRGHAMFPTLVPAVPALA